LTVGNDRGADNRRINKRITFGYWTGAALEKRDCRVDLVLNGERRTDAQVGAKRVDRGNAGIDNNVR
jgi:hypothetical protein